MKLFVRRDASTDNSGFTVFDESGHEKYYAVFKKTHPALKLDITDTQKNVIAKIRRVPLPAIQTYKITADSKNIRLVFSKTKDGKIGCYLYGINWHICGDLATKLFSIIDVDNTVIATHKKRYLLNDDSCELNINVESHEQLCVAASVCINLINTVDNLVIQTV